MDPFVEGQKWSDCHHGLISVIRESLVLQVRPHYVVEIEKHVYLQYELSLENTVIEPDSVRTEARQDAAAVVLEPVLLTAPIPEERRVAFLTVRERETREVVTTIEVLSPVNKRSASRGRRKYLRKREAVLQSASHLIELDLLRGGRRLPMREPLPPGDYYAFVSREWQRPQVAVYAWPLSHALPSVPVPLASGDPDVTLDLQAIFNTVYDRAGYDYSLDYRRPVEPPLSAREAAWVEERLSSRTTADAVGPARGTAEE